MRLQNKERTEEMFENSIYFLFQTLWGKYQGGHIYSKMEVKEVIFPLVKNKL